MVRTSDSVFYNISQMITSKFFRLWKAAG